MLIAYGKLTAMSDVALLVLGWVGAAQALLLALAVGTRRTARPTDHLLALLLVTAATAALSISARHAGWGAGALWYAVETAATLTSGPLLYAWLRRRCERPWPTGALAASLLPLGAWLTALLAAGLGGRNLPWLPIEVTLAYQAIWTVAGVWFVTRSRDLVAPGRRAAVAGLLAMGVLHIAELVRWLFAARAPAAVVPWAITLLVLALGFIALRESALFAAGAGAAEVSDERSQQLTAAARQAIEAERLYLDPAANATTVAQHLGVSPSTLSRALARCGVGSVPELLAAARIAEARRLLADPALDHLAIEAIGTRSGFRSRSAFYESCRRHLGMSPAEYRKQVRGGAA